MKNAPLDDDVLQDLIRQIGRPNLHIICTKVEREFTIHWDQLLSASRAGDSQEAQRQAHGLSSVLKTVGLLPMGNALADIETKLRSGSNVDPVWVEALEPQKLQSMKALTELIESESSAPVT